MLNQKEITQLNIGDKIDHFFFITKSEIKKTKNNDEYISFEFADKKSVINAYLWKDRKEFEVLRSLALEGNLTGKIIKVKGDIREFNNNLNINIENIRLSEPTDKLDIKDFMKTSERDIDGMKGELISYINSIKNDYLHKLLQKIFDEERLVKFSEHPAGKMWHHSYIGGLIEHTLEIVSICDLICKFHKEINRDLLITGAILHDIGKTIEINSEPGFEYSTEGKLLGHIVIAATMVEKEINKIKNFPDDLRINLLHLILSHQGKLEQASPVVPKTLEAITLYHADELSAKTNAYKLSLERELKSPSGWTKFLNLAGTELYNYNSRPQLTIEKETLFD